METFCGYGFSEAGRFYSVITLVVWIILAWDFQLLPYKSTAFLLYFNFEQQSILLELCFVFFNRETWDDYQSKLSSNMHKLLDRILKKGSGPSRQTDLGVCLFCDQHL